MGAHDEANEVVVIAKSKTLLHTCELDDVDNGNLESTRLQSGRERLLILPRRQMICHGLPHQMTLTMVQPREMGVRREYAVLQRTIIERKNCGKKRRGFVPRRPIKGKAGLIVVGLMVSLKGPH